MIRKTWTYKTLTSGYFKHFIASSGGDPVHCRSGGHTAGEALHSGALEVGDVVEVVREDSQRVGGGHEERASTDYHVPVT